jgi:sialidase-1
VLNKIRLLSVALLATVWATSGRYATLLVAAEPQGKPAVSRGALGVEGHFDIRVVHEIAPERTSNWAVKITEMPDGRLLMVWCSTAGEEYSKTNRLWTSYSSDDGKTWSRPKIFAESTSRGGSVLNPCCYTHSDGTVFIIYNAITGKQPEESYRVVYQTLHNGSATWGSRRTMPVGDGDTGLLSSPIRLRDGAIVLPTFFKHGKNCWTDQWIASVMRSVDSGHTWSRGGVMPVDAPRGAMEPTIAELSDGRLYCLIRTRTGWLYQSWSNDGGQTWTKPTQSQFPSPEATPILSRLADGSLILVWNNTPPNPGISDNGPRYPLCAALSDDDGKTWPHQRAIATTSGAQQLSNHGVFQTRAGTILVPMNHFQGIRKNVDYGPIVLARFDQAWLRSPPSSQKTPNSVPKL